MAPRDSGKTAQRGSAGRRRLLGWSALLLLFLVPAALSLRGDAITFDETAHLPAGWSYLVRGDFRLNPQHPPLAKLVGALPLQRLVGEARVRWDTDSRWARADEWGFGFRLLNPNPGINPRTGAADLLPPLPHPVDSLTTCRLAMLVFGVLLIVVVQRLGTALFGETAGWISAGLTALSPTVLAHARLVNTDVAGAAGVALAMWMAWRWLQRPTTRRALLIGAAVGVALLTKFSGVLVVPLILLGALLAMLGRSPTGGERLEARCAGLHALLAMSTCIFVLWAGYGFRQTATPGDERPCDWSETEAAPAWLVSPLRGADDLGLLPEAWLFGIAKTAAAAGERAAFLDGERSFTGWWQYFPLAFLWKTPGGLLLLLLLAGVAALRQPRLRRPMLWLVTWAGTVFALAMAGNLDIGQRHLLPAYPALFLLAGGGAAALWSSRAGRGAAIIGLLAFAIASATAFPRYLGWFSLLGGGRESGWTRLVDSNLDWGQDLIRLREWIERQEVDEVWLAWFGTADPVTYRVPHRKFLSYLNLRPEIAGAVPPSGSLLAISATLLQGVYLPAELQGWVRRLREGARPVARVGDSIFIYRVP